MTPDKRMAEASVSEQTAIQPLVNSPRTDELIARVMAQYPSMTDHASAKYFEAVHQELAPLARSMEKEIIALQAAAALRTSIKPTPLTRERIVEIAKAADGIGNVQLITINNAGEEVPTFIAERFAALLREEG